MKVKSKSISSGTDYYLCIVNAAVKKLRKSTNQTPISESELVRGIVSILRKEYGRKDRRHSAKDRFKKSHFKTIVTTKEWLKHIDKVDDKYALKSWNLAVVKSSEQKITLERLDYPTLSNNLLFLLKQMSWQNFEILITAFIQKKLGPDFIVTHTKLQGDHGIDVFAEKKDDDLSNDGRKKAVIVQAKKYDSTVDIKYARGFIGTVTREIENNNWTQCIGIFVTTGRLPRSFQEEFNKVIKNGVTYISLDGKELVENLISLEMGLSYSIDIDFWKKIDSSLMGIYE